jgi:cob(I)alamin adenosyltransferase
MSIKKGLVYVFTGDGKGKTTAALGVAVRALARGMKVGWVSWFKEEKWRMSELGLKGKIEMHMMGKGFYNLPGDKATPEEHKKAAEAGLKKTESLLSKVDVLVLDEVNKAVKDKLVGLNDLINLISKKGKTHLVLTGRGMDKQIVELADLVTEMKKIKHPFDKGIKAVKGLDY